MQFLDKYGWPVERIKGRSFVNVIRLLLWTRKIRRGKWRRSDRFTMNVKIRNLTKSHLIALEDLFRTWEYLGIIGSSRWTKFYSDGDGNFRPKITIEGKKPQWTDLVSNDSKWPKGSGGEYQIDFDWIAWELHEEVEQP